MWSILHHSSRIGRGCIEVCRGHNASDRVFDTLLNRGGVPQPLRAAMLSGEPRGLETLLRTLVIFTRLSDGFHF
jgi:hypothetical protein